MFALLMLLGCLLAGPAFAQPTPGQWYEVPNTRLIDYEKKPQTYPDYNPATQQSPTYERLRGSTGFPALVSAWTGGAYAPSRKTLYILGGGHGDYAGNDVYAFNLETLTLSRIKDAYPTVDPYSSLEATGFYPLANDPNTPNTSEVRANHWYNVLQWVEPLKAVCALGEPSAYNQSSLWPAPIRVNCFYPDEQRWRGWGTITGDYTLTRGSYSTSDPTDPYAVWIHTSTYGAALHRCSFQSSTQTVACERRTPYQDVSYDRTAVMDSQLRLWAVGRYSSTQGDTTRGKYTQPGIQAAPVSITTTGAKAIENYQSPGLVYLPAPIDKVVGWATGKDIYYLDMATANWTVFSPVGGADPGPPTPTGTYGRFQCDAALQRCVVVNSVFANIFVFQFPQATPPPPPPPPAGFAVGALQNLYETPEQLSLWMPFTGSVPLTVRATMRYRQVGTTQWVTGHELSRVRPELSQPGTANPVVGAFSWPVLDLQPGTRYEVEVTLSDGNQQEVRTATLATRALPGTSHPANKFATVGMNGSQLRSLINSLVPGDVLQLPNGTYNIDDSPIQIDINGTAEQPIVIRGESQAGTIVTRAAGSLFFPAYGGSHFRIENLTLRGSGVDGGTNAGSVAFFGYSGAHPVKFVVRDTTITGVDKCIVGRAWDGALFYRNTCLGNNQWTAEYLGATAEYPNGNRTWNDDGINLPGLGNVAFNNTVMGFGDCASFAEGGHADVDNRALYQYRNSYRNCGDDLVEVDHLYGPGAFYDNYATNVMTCLSIDPLYGGPFMYARNICLGAQRQTFKLTDGNSNWFAYNNTIATAGKNQSVQAGILSFSSGLYAEFTGGNPQASFGLQNNIILYCEGEGRPLYWETPFWPDTDGFVHVDWTHNSWGVGSDTRFTVQPYTYSSLIAAQAGIPDTRPVFGSSTKRFEQDNVVTCQPFVDTVGVGPGYPTPVGGPFNLGLKPGGVTKNSGVPIAGVTDGFSGSAPDRGAVIEGRASPVYGAPTLNPCP